MAISFNLNGTTVSVQAEPDTPLLWVIRDEVGLTGTKFGCGAALCGACTVHLNGSPIRSCQTPVSAVAGKKKLPRSSRSPQTTRIRCKKHGSSIKCRSAVIASRVS